MQIKDGTGQGFLVKIDKQNRIVSFASSFAEIVSESLQGNSFNFLTDFITYTTTGSERALLFIQNTSATKNLHISTVSISLNASSKIRLRKNPTSIAGGAPGIPVNTNFQSGRTFDGVFTIGADGATIVGGSLIAAAQLNAFINFPLAGEIILGQSDTLAMTVEIASGTVEASITITAFHRDASL